MIIFPAGLIGLASVTLAAATGFSKDVAADRRWNELSRRSSLNYIQNYTTGGDVEFTSTSSGFSVNWDTSDDFVVGRGWNPGSTDPINFDGSFSVSGGTGLLSVYGWSTDPLIEYYIIEDHVNPPTEGTIVGSVTSDGSSYTVWKNTRVDAPSIEGTTTFTQYLSVRDSPRSSGTVTVSNHFTAWASLGLNLGTLNFQVIAVEGWGGGTGASSQDVSN